MKENINKVDSAYNYFDHLTELNKKSYDNQKRKFQEICEALSGKDVVKVHVFSEFGETGTNDFYFDVEAEPVKEVIETQFVESMKALPIDYIINKDELERFHKEFHSYCITYNEIVSISYQGKEIYNRKSFDTESKTD